MIYSFNQRDVFEVYKSLHKIPETENEEYKTSEYIRSFLNSIGLKPIVCNNTGTYADIVGKEDGKTILLRADMDALPIKEESGVEFASEHDGKMHACGHDMHTACLLFAAKALSENADKLKGTVRVLFQPAEEGKGGAEKMIKEGALDGVDSAFAMHVDPMEATGMLLYKDGGITASPDDYKIVIRGKGGHGAEPKACVNPLSVAALMVNRFDKIKGVYFENDECVTTVCTIHGGTLNNIIPDYAEITGTARSFDSEVREKLKKTLRYYANKTAEEYGAKIEFSYNELFPPTVCDKNMNEIVVASALKTEGIIGVRELEEGSMTGDDFSYFAEKVPSSYFRLGVGGKNDKKDARYPLHSSKFKIDEKALIIGTKLLVNIVNEFLN